MVYWAELQAELSGAGLNVAVGIPKPGYPWFGKIDDKPFTMTIVPKSDKDGFRDYMICSLYGQDDAKVVPALSKFMGYAPFCRYKHKVNSQASATYEWGARDPAGRLEELTKDSDVYELEKLADGFNPPQTDNMERFYGQFTPEILTKWEEAVRKDADATWSGQSIKGLLPFAKRVMPMVAQTQSLFGFTIICLESKLENEEEVVGYGLQPLIVVNIITQQEADSIIEWYLQTEPQWDAAGGRGFSKELEIEGVKYRLMTDVHRGCRDLMIQVLN